MPLIFAAGIVIVIIWVAMCIVDFILKHIVEIGLILGIGVPAVSLLLWALIRGAGHHTVVGYTPQLTQARARRTLPPPVMSAAWAPGAGAFSTAAGTVIEDDGTPDEPEPAAAELCCLPGCGVPLGEEVWDVTSKDEYDPDAGEETHRFCSEVHAELWVEQVQAPARKN